ncbi:MAG TPA: glycosyltransferase [Longimicrobiales bacterium]|nr:glycosyltransferase [Longimicrobiales bacterium]
MKLCALTQSYADTGGGVRTMIHAERDRFRAMPGAEHVLIVPGAEDTVTRDGNLTTYTIRSPFVPGSSVYRLLLRSRAVLRILEAEKPDVIEAHCAYNLPWTAMLHRRRHGGIVSGVYMTDLPVAYVETPLRPRVGRRLAGAARAVTESYVRRLYRRCDVVVGISPVIRQRLVDLGVEHAECVPLGVDLDTFHPSRRSPALRSTHGVTGDALMFVYAGRLDGEKRPDIVLEAFAQVRASATHDALRNAVLVMAGDGPMRPRLEERGAEIGNVRVLDFVQDRLELATLLASADVYVSGMPHETFGLSVVEAQACGLPVVGVRAGAMVDRVADGDDGFLVTPDSPADMAARIMDTDPACWPAMGARARRRVGQEFSWDRTFQRLLTLYREALDARGS